MRVCLEWEGREGEQTHNATKIGVIHVHECDEPCGGVKHGDVLWDAV